MSCDLRALRNAELHDHFAQQWSPYFWNAWFMYDFTKKRRDFHLQVASIFRLYFTNRLNDNKVYDKLIDDTATAMKEGSYVLDV